MANQGALGPANTPGPEYMSMPLIATNHPSLPTPYTYNPANLQELWWRIQIPSAGTIQFDGYLSTLPDGTIITPGSEPYSQVTYSSVVAPASVTDLSGGNSQKYEVTFAGPQDFWVGGLGLHSLSDYSGVNFIMNVTSSDIIMDDVAPPPPPPPPPADPGDLTPLGADMFAEAQQLSYGAKSTPTPAASMSATNEAGDPMTFANHTAWWKVAVPRSEIVGVTLHAESASLGFAYLRVYRGTSIDALTLIASDARTTGPWSTWASRTKFVGNVGEWVYIEAGISTTSGQADTVYTVTAGQLIVGQVQMPVVGPVTVEALNPGVAPEHPNSTVVGSPPQWADGADGTYAEIWRKDPSGAPMEKGSRGRSTLSLFTEDPDRVVDISFNLRASASLSGGVISVQIDPAGTNPAETWALDVPTSLQDLNVYMRTDYGDAVNQALDAMAIGGVPVCVVPFNNLEWAVTVTELTMQFDMIAEAASSSIDSAFELLRRRFT